MQNGDPWRPCLFSMCLHGQARRLRAGSNSPECGPWRPSCRFEGRFDEATRLSIIKEAFLKASSRRSPRGLLRRGSSTTSATEEDPPEGPSVVAGKVPEPAKGAPQGPLPRGRLSQGNRFEPAVNVRAPGFRTHHTKKKIACKENFAFLT